MFKINITANLDPRSRRWNQPHPIRIARVSITKRCQEDRVALAAVFLFMGSGN